MTHYGIVSPAAIGHLNPMCALGRELQRRGNIVTLFGVADLESKVKNSGLNYCLIAEDEYPIGRLEQDYEKLGKLNGNEGLKYTIQLLLDTTSIVFNHIPEAIESEGVEALIVDQVVGAGGTVADKLKLPFVTICNALLTNQEPGVPPYFTNWTQNKALWAKLRNQTANFFLNQKTLLLWEAIQKQRKEWQLPLHKNREDSYSKLAQISQLPIEFDFTRNKLAKCFHYTGPLQNPSGKESIQFDIPFPWEKLTGKPLIYASLGTLQNKVPEVFQCIAKAVEGLDIQLVISLGNPNNKPADYNLPESTIVVPFAPHQQLINKASLIVTHAGMNTTLGALSDGVPLVAIPITNEQPGIAARIATTGAGEVVTLKHLNIKTLATIIKRVLTETSYKDNALRLQKAIKNAGGVKKAADIVEKAMSTRQPVISSIN